MAGVVDPGEARASPLTGDVNSVHSFGSHGS